MWSYAVAGVFTFVPVVLYVTGLILALVRRSKHPRRSTFATIGFAVLIVDGLLATVWVVTGPMLVTHGWSISRYAALTGVFGTVETILLLGGWVLILVALFGRERTAPAQPVPAQQSPLQQPPQPPFPGQRPPGY